MTRGGQLMNRIACFTISFLTLGACATDPADPVDPADQPVTDEAPAPDLGAAATTSAINHVFVIVMENHGASDIYGNVTHAPYINNTLIPQFGRATNFIDKLPQLASEPLYVWMEAGTNASSDHTFTTDNNASASN